MPSTDKLKRELYELMPNKVRDDDPHYKLLWQQGVNYLLGQNHDRTFWDFEYHRALTDWYGQKILGELIETFRAWVTNITPDMERRLSVLQKHADNTVEEIPTQARS